MKNPTNWSNNDIKQADVWTDNDVKKPAAWVNNDNKPATAWTPQSKQTDVWSVNYNKPQTYLYNSAYMTYNSTLADYNYLVNTNSLNQKLQTRWSTN